MMSCPSPAAKVVSSRRAGRRDVASARQAGRPGVKVVLQVTCCGAAAKLLLPRNKGNQKT